MCAAMTRNGASNPVAVDTPAKIIVLGAGPIGVEAALYARFLGYEVTVLDRGEVGENLLRWGHVRMFTPFGLNRTLLGKSALLAQNSEFKLPADDELLTGRQHVERYLRPLSETDLLADSILTRHTVLAVSRGGQRKGDRIGHPSRNESPFQTLIRDAQGHEHILESDVVLDCTGVFGNPNYLGQGGMPAIGELECRARIEYGLIDLAGRDRDRFAGCHVLVIGAGYSAATNICELGNLARESLDTHVTWISRDLEVPPEGPVRLIPDDRLPHRQQVAQSANLLATNKDRHVTHWPATLVSRIHYDEHTDQFQVTLAGTHAGVHTFDRVIANVGYRPDLDITRELQLHSCYATEGPIKLAAQLLASDSADCLDVRCEATEALINPEPNFYVLGAKSYGRLPKFLLQSGLDQIRQVFTILGDRETLNLYAQPLE